MKKVLVLVFTNLKNDARVTRQVQWLKKKHELTVICFDSDELPDITVVRINKTRLSLSRKALLSAALVLRQYSLAYKILHSYEKFVKPLDVPSYDLVVANDIDTLPMAFSLKARKVLFDAHEYAPRHFENNRIWRTFFQSFYQQLCKKYIPRVDAMLTVGKGLADEYAKNFGVKATIVTNATRYFDLQPSTVNPEMIRLVHHGIANESRRLELMIEMMANLQERFTLDLFLLTSDYASRKTKAYIKAFTLKAEENPRIKIFPPVKSTQVVNTINQYDLGVFLIPPINFNYANTLPNKLFDFIQARLGIAIGPTPEMASIVNTYGNGVVSENFEPESLARKLNQLKTEDIIGFKNQSSFAAKELNAEKNEIVFTGLTDRLLLS